MKCKTCHGLVKSDCDYKQGRCPNRKPMIEIQPKDTSRGHFYVSLAKSGLRILAGANLMFGHFYIAGLLLILAEILGIVEELV
jgi:hypothetical protein